MGKVTKKGKGGGTLLCKGVSYPYLATPQSHLQGVLSLCEFHYLDFSKNSINLPYANFGLFHFISATFLGQKYLPYVIFWLFHFINAIFLANLAYANLFQNQKLHWARTLFQPGGRLCPPNYCLPTWF